MKLKLHGTIERRDRDVLHCNAATPTRPSLIAKQTLSACPHAIPSSKNDIGLVTGGLAKWARTISVQMLLLCAVALLFTQALSAQSTGSGSIQGTVTDPTGALLPNAQVRLVETSTQVSLTAKTNGSGAYAFPSINVGTYTVTVIAAGFETYSSTGIVLEVGSSIAINAKMTVGREATLVVVSSQGGVALQTEDPSFKQTIDQRELTEIPLNGRQITSLITLSGGANSAGVQDATGSKFPAQAVTISIAGAGGNMVSYRLDGGDNQDYMGGGNNPLPFPDALSQFSVETAALAPQDGVHIGGLVNAVTRSGTNSFHGSAFEFFRNNIIDATNFFATCTPVAPATTCTAKDTLHQNEYGGTFGGPVRIPKLFDGRSKLFFFAAYQHEKDDSSTSTSNAYVPTPANLAGDFSITDPPPGSAKTICGSAAQLYDPVTGLALPGNKYNQPGGPTLPAFNAAALALIKYFPPVQPLPDGSDACGHVAYAIPSRHFDSQFDTRVDYTISKNNNMYVRYFLDSYQNPSYFFPNNIFVTTASGNPEIRYQTLTIGENWIITPSIVNSAHLTGSRRTNTRGFNAATPNVTSLGVKDFQLIPAGIYINNGTSGKNHGGNIGGGSNLQATLNDNVPFDLSDGVTWIVGKHQIVFGGELVRNQLNVNNGYQGDGNFTFNGQYSGTAPGAATTIAGDSNLDLLTGMLGGFTQSAAQQNALRGWVITAFVQDTFHSTPKLTLTGGISWQPLYLPHDYFHRGSTFSLAAFVANQTSTVYPTAPAGSLYYGDSGVTPNFITNSPLTFNPTVGLAYDVYGNGKTVFRTGIAYAHDQPNFFIQQRIQLNPPFSQNVSPNAAAPYCFSEPWLIGGTGRGCNQVGGTDTDPYPVASPPTKTTAVFPPQGQYIVLQPHYQEPNTLQWTASLQQEFPRGWMAQIFYTGNRTQHMVMGIPFNPATFVPGAWGANGTGCSGVATTGTAAVAAKTLGGGAVGSPCSTSANQQARFLLANLNPAQGNQYVGGGGGSLTETTSGYANYNGMIATLQHRFSQSFSVLTNYTFSKCLNNSDPQGDISGTQLEDPNNPRADYGRCGSETRNIYNMSVIAKSAFPIHGIRARLLNNWEIAPLIHTTSGTPFTVGAGSDLSLTGINNDRANQIPGITPYSYAKIRVLSSTGTRSYLNQAAFAQVTSGCPASPTAVNCPGIGTYGNTGRNAFNGPMLFNMDAQLSRIFPIEGVVSLDARIEAYNVLNHPSFGNPSSNNPTSGTFGYITGTSNSARVFQGALKVFF